MFTWFRRIPQFFIRTKTFSEEKTSKIYVLLYHDISASLQESALCSCPRFTTEIDRLKSQLLYIKKIGLKPLRFKEWIDARSKGIELPGAYVILTFDGPHQGWFKHAIPLLVEFDMPATFFITAGWVGENHLYPESQGLSWNDVENLLKWTDTRGKQLFEIGSHSMWHSVLLKQTEEAEAAFQQRLEEEIIKPSHLLHKMTGVHVVSYATPKGQGEIDVLRPYFKEAGIQAVRGASDDVQVNSYYTDLMDVQICYSDQQRFSMRVFRKALSMPLAF